MTWRKQPYLIDDVLIEATDIRSHIQKGAIAETGCKKFPKEMSNAWKL